MSINCVNKMFFDRSIKYLNEAEFRHYMLSVASETSKIKVISKIEKYKKYEWLKHVKISKENCIKVAGNANSEEVVNHYTDCYLQKTKFRKEDCLRITVLRKNFEDNFIF